MSLPDLVLHIMVYGGATIVVYTGIILAICQLLKSSTRETKLSPDDTKLVKILSIMGEERRGVDRDLRQDLP